MMQIGGGVRRRTSQIWAPGFQLAQRPRAYGQLPVQWPSVPTTAGGVSLATGPAFAVSRYAGYAGYSPGYGQGPPPSCPPRKKATLNTRTMTWSCQPISGGGFFPGLGAGGGAGAGAPNGGGIFTQAIRQAQAAQAAAQAALAERQAEAAAAAAPTPAPHLPFWLYPSYQYPPQVYPGVTGEVLPPVSPEAPTAVWSPTGIPTEAMFAPMGVGVAEPAAGFPWMLALLAAGGVAAAFAFGQQRK